ncbi:MAG: DUF2281 domain-containing protein [Chloroflexi bacterium]|nr:DUF2281 domain-containing protein [Chloroflexota bacterium]
MDVTDKTLEELIEELSPALRVEVRDFVEFLLTKQERHPGRALRQDWAGALQAFRDQYTSVELQHLASDWRSE